MIMLAILGSSMKLQALFRDASLIGLLYTILHFFYCKSSDANYPHAVSEVSNSFFSVLFFKLVQLLTLLPEQFIRLFLLSS